MGTITNGSTYYNPSGQAQFVVGYEIISNERISATQAEILLDIFTSPKDGTGSTSEAVYGTASMDNANISLINPNPIGDYKDPYSGITYPGYDSNLGYRLKISNKDHGHKNDILNNKIRLKILLNNITNDNSFTTTLIIKFGTKFGSVSRGPHEKFKLTNFQIDAPPTYTIKWMNGNTQVKSVTKDYATTYYFDHPSITIPSGKKFQGWYSGTTKYENGALYEGKKDLTLTASFENIPNNTIILKANIRNNNGNQSILTTNNGTNINNLTDRDIYFSVENYDASKTSNEYQQEQQHNITITAQTGYSFPAQDTINGINFNISTNKKKLTITIPSNLKTDKEITFKLYEDSYIIDYFVGINKDHCQKINRFVYSGQYNFFDGLNNPSNININFNQTINKKREYSNESRQQLEGNFTNLTSLSLSIPSYSDIPNQITGYPTGTNTTTAAAHAKFYYYFQAPEIKLNKLTIQSSDIDQKVFSNAAIIQDKNNNDFNLFVSNLNINEAKDYENISFSFNDNNFFNSYSFSFENNNLIINLPICLYYNYSSISVFIESIEYKIPLAGTNPYKIVNLSDELIKDGLDGWYSTVQGSPFGMIKLAKQNNSYYPFYWLTNGLKLYKISAKNTPYIKNDNGYYKFNIENQEWKQYPST